CLVFFFSSRRRHTRSKRDWSSDVCSSDLTYRTESYQTGSRKPTVAYGDTLDGDLSRRDFTVNAMALRLPDLVFVDPFGGLADLEIGRASCREGVGGVGGQGAGSRVSGRVD